MYNKMKTLKQYPIIIYVGLLVLLSTVPFALMYQAADSESELATFLLMWVPAISAIIHRLFFRQPVLKNIGWNPIKSVKWLAIGMLVPLILSISVVGLQVFLGFVEYNPLFFNVKDGLVSIKGVAMIFGAAPQPFALFIGNFLLSFLVGNLIYMITFALGEEYGWRGHLQPLLLQKYSLKYAFIVLGIIWGLWHFPAILLGHNYPEYPLLGGLVLMPITCIAFSVAFGIAYIKGKSLWIPVMFHSALNLAADMDDKMIITKKNVLGADLVWTGMWIIVAFVIYYSNSSNLKKKTIGI